MSRKRPGPRRARDEKIKPARRLAAVSAPEARPWFTSGIPNKVLTAFTRQMATLLEAGIPILRGLRSIEEQEENRALRAVLRELINEIEGGSMFSETLARHPKVFSRFYINMVVAGETAGMLDSSLARLADFLERTQRIRSKVVAALFYPAAVVVVATGILIVLAVFVIPKFKEVFADLTGSSSLPAFTEFVLGGSQYIKSHSQYFLGFALAIGAIFKVITATSAGRAVWDRLKLRLPVIGRIIRKAAIARFARTLGTMLENGVNILQALTIARETTSNAVFARAIHQTHAQIKDGDTLTAPLKEAGVFPTTVISMIDVGEQSGAMPAMLLKIANTYDDDVDNAMASALSLLAVLIIFLALLVIALFLPLIIAIDKGFDSGANQTLE